MNQRPVHSPLGASGAERWMECPGSVALLKELVLPETDEPEYRTQGTAGHEALATCLTSGADGWELIGQTYNTIVVDEEMANAIQVFIDEVRPLMRDAQVYIEAPISSDLHPMFYGTVDCGIQQGATLHVRDFKYGEGIVVEAEENPQIMYYAYGLLLQHPEVEHVTLGIVQPRAFHPSGSVRVWGTSAAHIRSWAETVLLPAMHRTELDDHLEAGPWCRFCPAKLVCPLLTSLFRAAAICNPKEVINISAESLGRSYQYVQGVKFYLKALEEEAFRRQSAGEDVPGTKLVNKKANRVFKSGAAEFFQSRYADDAMTKPALKSPAAMELISPEAKGFVHEYAYTPQTGLTLALESDKRVAVKVQTTSEAFPNALTFAGDDE